MYTRGSIWLSLLILLALMTVNGFFIYELYGARLAELTKPQPVATTTLAVATPATSTLWTVYRDESRKLAFSYPEAFGTTTPGVYRPGASAIVHFEHFSAPINSTAEAEGEVTLFITPNRFTAHVLGGFYDPLARSVVKPELLIEIDRQLPIISASNFCEELTKVRHLDEAKLKGSPAFEALTAVQKHSLTDIDVMRSLQSTVVSCVRNGSTITFHKTTRDHDLAPVQHVYGALQFLSTPNASFQLIKRSATTPNSEDMETMTKVVNSFQTLTAGE